MTVYVCPKLDAACPDWHGHWCPECPKHTETKEVAELRAQLAEKERECERLRKDLSASPHRSDCARDPFRILAGMSEAFSKCTCEHRRALENDDG